VLVVGGGPLRAYVHCNGLVLFSSEEYKAVEWQGNDGGVALVRGRLGSGGVGPGKGWGMAGGGAGTWGVEI
jgi:hypothetical protein